MILTSLILVGLSSLYTGVRTVCNSTGTLSSTQHNEVDVGIVALVVNGGSALALGQDAECLSCSCP